MNTKKNSYLTIGLLILINFLAYGLYIRSLGFYLDDWAFITPYRLNGFEGDGLYWFLLHENRPNTGDFYNLLFQWLRYSALNWQILILSLRILCSLAFYLLLKECFSKQSQIPLYTALFFSVYPTFKQTPTAIAYSLHWASLLILLISFIITALTIKKRIPTIPGHILALAFAIGSYMLIEYFVLLEFARLFLIALFIKRDINKTIKWVINSFLKWLPYIFALLGYLFWRFQLMPVVDVDDRNRPNFYKWIKEPVENVLEVISFYLSDLYKVLLLDIKNTFSKLLSTPVYKNPWVLILILLTLAIFLTLKTISSRSKEPVNYNLIALLGLIGLFCMGLGFLPGYAIGRHYGEANYLYNDRFALAATLGAALVWTSIIYLVPKQNIRFVLLAILLSSSTIFHMQNSIVYKSVTTKLNQYFWQLSWRAPALERGTAIFADGEFVSKMGDWPLSMAINNLYLSSHQDNLQLGYWFFDWDDGVPSDILESELYQAHKVISFWGLGKNNIGVYPPTSNSCLWILTPQENSYDGISKVGRHLAEISTINRISMEPAVSPPSAIFGAEPPHTWCYYYQKAALAAQFEEWDKVNQLWSAAAEQGYSPKNAVEMSPFIRALYKTNQPQKAEGLLLQAYKVDPKSATYLCELVESLVPDNNSPDWRQTIPCP